MGGCNTLCDSRVNLSSDRGTTDLRTAAILTRLSVHEYMTLPWKADSWHLQVIGHSGIPTIKTPDGPYDVFKITMFSEPNDLMQGFCNDSSFGIWYPKEFLQHDESNTAKCLIIQAVSLVDTSSDSICPVVEKVVVQLSISGTELLLI